MRKHFGAILLVQLLGYGFKMGYCVSAHIDSKLVLTILGELQHLWVFIILELYEYIVVDG